MHSPSFMLHLVLEAVALSGTHTVLGHFRRAVGSSLRLRMSVYVVVAKKQATAHSRPSRGLRWAVLGRMSRPDSRRDAIGTILEVPERMGALEIQALAVSEC